MVFEEIYCQHVGILLRLKNLNLGLNLGLPLQKLLLHFYSDLIEFRKNEQGTE